MSLAFMLDTSQSIQHLVKLACPPRDMVVERISSFIIPGVRPCSHLAKEKRLGVSKELKLCKVLGSFFEQRLIETGKAVRHVLCDLPRCSLFEPIPDPTVPTQDGTF